MSLPFIALVTVLFQLGYDFYCQEMMDYATQTAARQMQIGNAQASALGPAAFVQQSICNTLTGLLSCTGISMSSQVVVDYYNMTLAQIPTSNGAFNSAGLSFCAGAPGQLVLLTTYYPASALVSPFLPTTTVTVNGSPTNMLVSTAAFQNEQFSASGNAGC